MLDGAVEAIHPATAPTGLAAWVLTVRDRAQLNYALDRLRQATIEVEAIEPVRSSLEEVFLRAVKSADGERIGAAAIGGSDEGQSGREAEPR